MKKQTVTAEEYAALARAAWTEKQFQAAVIDEAHRWGWRAASFRCVRVQRKSGAVYYETPVGADGKGWPDLFLVHPSREVILAPELKVKNRKMTQEQRQWFAWLRAAGRGQIECVCWMPVDWPQIVALLKGS